jgi:hypothetical protein
MLADFPLGNHEPAYSPFLGGCPKEFTGSHSVQHRDGRLGASGTGCARREIAGLDQFLDLRRCADRKRREPGPHSQFMKVGDL